MAAPKRLIECVPNFSEGKDMALIGRLTDVIRAVEGVELLDVDPGKATNRTVVTFAGEPEAVLDAAVACGIDEGAGQAAPHAGKLRGKE